MARPTYEELQRRVQELEKLVDIKISPQDFYFEARDLICFRGYRDWSVDFFDRKIEALTGYRLEDFHERRIRWFDLIHPEDKERAREAVRQALKSDRYYKAEYRIVPRQGGVRWIRIRGHVSCDSKGNFLSVRGVLNDITLEKYGELTAGDEDPFAWAKNLSDGIYVVAPNYRIEFMNDTLMDLFGDHIGEICYRALFGRDSVCPWSVMDELTHEGTCKLQEYHFPESGRVFEVRSYPVVLKDGSIGKLGHFRDVTETKKLETELRELAARHQAVENAADRAALGIFILQDDAEIAARFRYVNQAMATITGYSQSELLDRGLADLVQPGKIDPLLESYGRSLSGDHIDPILETEIIRKDGKSIIVSLSLSAASYQGTPCAVGFLRDVTKRIRVQEALWQSQRLAAIGKLAAEIAHEINNPLTSALTFSKLLRRLLDQKDFPHQRLDEMRQYVAYLEGEASRCASIARGLLDFSREAEMEPRETQVQDLVDKTLDILRHKASLNNIDIRVHHLDDQPRIALDFKRMQQALLNICWNALEAMPTGGELQVTTSFDAAAAVVRLEIRDSGHGIPPEHLPRIFEPFFTTKSEGKGVGLGLAVAYGIVRQHRGRITVDSTPGQGTCFTIELPAAGVAAATDTRETA